MDGGLICHCGIKVQIGDWPFCPHGPAKHFNRSDDPIEPYWDEHINQEGAWITTRGQRRQLMRENGSDYLESNDRMTGSKRRVPGQVKYLDLGRR